MIFRLIARVESDSVIDSPYQVQVEDYVVGVECDQNKFVNRMRIEKRVSNYQTFLPKISADPNSVPAVEVPLNPFAAEMRGLLQQVEAAGGFLFGIYRIHWDSAAEEWVAESDEEKRHLSITRWSYAKEYQRQPKALTPARLSALVAESPKFNSLVVPLSFFREGAREFQSFRYINAFHNFYYMIEGLYGAGNTRNRLVERSFNNSQQLTDAIGTVLQRSGDSSDQLSNKQLLEYLRSQGCDLTVRGTISFIVKLRGTLHHFVQGSSLKQGHPLNHEDYRLPAYLLMSTCVFLMTSLYVERSPQLAVALAVRSSNHVRLCNTMRRCRRHKWSLSL